MRSMLDDFLNQVHHGDCRQIMDTLPDECIDLSVWSPPYYVGKDYEEYLPEFSDWQNLLSETIQKHYRIMKPGSFVVINIGDILCFVDENIPKFQTNVRTRKKIKLTKEEILEVIEENPNYNRYQLAKYFGISEQTIQRRLEGVNIRGGKYQPETKVKQVSGLIEKWAEDAGFYIKDSRIWIKDPAWANSKWVGSTVKAVDETEHLFFLWKPGETVYDKKRLTSEEWSNWGDRQTWFIDSVRKNDDHEAKFPIELPKRAIKLLTDKDAIVLDPFMGSGTTAMAAIELGRNYIGIEIDADSVELSRKNTSQQL